MPTKTVVVVLALAAASCSAGDAAVPGIEGRSVIATSDAPVSDSDPAATEPVTTTIVTTTIATTTTTSATTTTGSSTATGPASACDSLRSDGYDTRKQTLAALTETEVAAVNDSCGDALDRLRGAMTIEQRMSSFAGSPAPLAGTDLVCNVGDFSLTVTNNADHPIGIHASLRLQADDVEGLLGSTLQPMVIWSIAAGESAPLSAKYEVNRPTDAALTCEVDITAFDATPGDADASLGEAVVPELTGDDPAQWLPFLVAQGAAIIGSGDPDLAAVVEDVRSADFASVVSSTRPDVGAPPLTGTISVCTASIEQPDDRHISIVYFDERADSSELQHGLFRRGNDGQWRWLSSSVYFDSREYWDCGTPSVNR